MIGIIIAKYEFIVVVHIYIILSIRVNSGKLKFKKKFASLGISVKYDVFIRPSLECIIKPAGGKRNR